VNVFVSDINLIIAKEFTDYFLERIEEFYQWLL
jgi:hypothetical protein